LTPETLAVAEPKKTSQPAMRRNGRVDVIELSQADVTIEAL